MTIQERVLEIRKEITQQLGTTVEIQILIHDIPSKAEAKDMSIKMSQEGFGAFRPQKGCNYGSTWYSNFPDNPIDVALFYNEI